MNKFKLTNLVLYAKGWYLRTDNIWKDLKKILELDNYTPFDNEDVYLIITSAVQNFQGIETWTELREVLFGIQPSECWKYGYYVKESESWAGKNTKVHDYDIRTAFIYYVISNLRFMESKYWDVKIPKVTKYPKAKHVTVKSLYEHFSKK